MTEARPWHATYPPDVPTTLEPYPTSPCSRCCEAPRPGFPDRPALAFFGPHMSYATLLPEVERFSAVLAGLGVQQGDRVGLLLPNCPEYVIALFACQRIGRGRGRQQPAVHRARAGAPDQGLGRPGHDRARPDLPRLRRSIREAAGVREVIVATAQPLHAPADQVAGAAEVHAPTPRSTARRCRSSRRGTGCAGGPT